jgi:hypothetical protein
VKLNQIVIRKEQIKGATISIPMFQTQQGAGGSSVVAVQTPTSFSSTSLVNSPHHPAGSWSLQRKQSPDGRPSNNRALDGGHNKNTLSRPTISGGLSTACPS